MLATCGEMKRTEDEAFARGISAEALMEEAGRGIAGIVRQFFPQPGTCVAVCGKGHNAGDALVAARHLAGFGWNIVLDIAAPSLAPLTQKKRDELGSPQLRDRPSCAEVVLDGLLGIGARGEPRGGIAEAIHRINARRQNGAWVLAIDVPSGLDADSGMPAPVCVQADLTAAIGAVKQGLVADSAGNFVGRLAPVPLAELIVPESPWQASTAKSLRSCLPPRPFDLHKGRAGRVGIVAGSPGFLGAARLCSAAAVRAGAGLVTLFARPETASLLAASCVPEVMIRVVGDYREVLGMPFDALAVGPGLGLAAAGEIRDLVREAPQPVVVDADALNALADDPSVLARCAGPRLLTPHPGEMERLLPREGRTRRAWLEAFLEKYPATLLLKGARTLIGEGETFRRFNTTGNPGMASGGMGDVLTGICAALIGQTPTAPLGQSAALGAWLGGRAAECSVFGPGGAPEAFCASDGIAHLGAAFTDLRRGVW